MSASKIGRKGLQWPVCTLLFLLGVGALGYWSYTKYQEEQATTTRLEMRGSPAARAASPPSRTAPPAGPPRADPAYRGQIPTSFLVGFSAVMALILGTVLYLWWSLKDLEGGKRVGEEEEEKKPPVGKGA